MMDSLKNAVGMGDNNKQAPTESTEQSSGGGGGFLGGLGDKFNSAAGGGKESEKNEDYLDKGQSIHPYYPIPGYMCPPMQ